MQINKTPSRRNLNQKVTLWNYSKNKTENGANINVYIKSYLMNVRYNFKSESSNKSSINTKDNIVKLYIFNDVSTVTGEDGTIKNYVPSYLFLKSSEQKNIWTLTDGCDFIGLGIIYDEISKGGEYDRKDYKIISVSPKYADSDRIHHWEVIAK